MEFQQALEHLQQSEAYQEYEEQHHLMFLSHGFVMVDGTNESEWQIGFYDPNDHEVVAFTVGDTIVKNPPAEPLSKDKQLQPLDTGSITITAKEAYQQALEVQKEFYKPHTPSKAVVILQTLDDTTVYNITFITHTFKTLNIHISAQDASCLKHEMVELFKFQ